MSRGNRIAAVVAALSVFAAAAPALAAPTPAAPDAVLNAAKNGPYAKLGPWLANLYQEYREATGKGVTARTF
jgi:hypothetical protein